jgi:hypothetical protein
MWQPLKEFPFDYPDKPLLVAAVDKETGEVLFFVCKEGDGGKFFPVRWGPQDIRPGIEWLWLQENGWTPFAWSDVLPDFPQWPLSPATGDLDPE